MNATETETWSSDQVVKRIGVTYRQLDHWCRNGVFGEQHRDPGSGKCRRFGQHELLSIAVVTRVSETLQELLGARSSGSIELYAGIVESLHGARVKNIVIKRFGVDISTKHGSLSVFIGDLLTADAAGS